VDPSREREHFWNQLRDTSALRKVVPNPRFDTPPNGVSTLKGRWYGTSGFESRAELHSIAIESTNSLALLEERDDADALVTFSLRSPLHPGLSKKGIHTPPHCIGSLTQSLVVSPGAGPWEIACKGKYESS
jgi:hypothetical protein